MVTGCCCCCILICNNNFVNDIDFILLPNELCSFMTYNPSLVHFISNYKIVETFKGANTYARLYMSYWWGE